LSYRVLRTEACVWCALAWFRDLGAGFGTADRDYRDWTLLFFGFFGLTPNHGLSALQRTHMSLLVVRHLFGLFFVAPGMLSNRCTKALFEFSSQSALSAKGAAVFIFYEHKVGVVVV